MITDRSKAVLITDRSKAVLITDRSKAVLITDRSKAVLITDRSKAVLITDRSKSQSIFPQSPFALKPGTVFKLKISKKKTTKKKKTTTTKTNKQSNQTRWYKVKMSVTVQASVFREFDVSPVLPAVCSTCRMLSSPGTWGWGSAL